MGESLQIRDYAAVEKDPEFETLVKKQCKIKKPKLLLLNDSQIVIIAKGGGMEKVVYSGRIVKITSKGMPNLRVLVVTDKAVYNLPVSDYSVLKRRIPLEIITSATASRISSETVLHVPSEYDFRFQIVLTLFVVRLF